MYNKVLILERSDCFKRVKIFLEKNYDLSKINKFNLMTVLKEAINNIFEHGKPPGKLLIYEKEKYIEISISDESEGFDFYKEIDKSIEINNKINLLEDSRGIFLITSLSDEYNYDKEILSLRFYKEGFNENFNC